MFECSIVMKFKVIRSVIIKEKETIEEVVDMHEYEDYEPGI